MTTEAGWPIHSARPCSSFGRAECLRPGGLDFDDELGETSGYWCLAGDTITATWPYRPTTARYTGEMAEFAIYPVQLSDQQMRERSWANH